MSVQALLAQWVITKVLDLVMHLFNEMGIKIREHVSASVLTTNLEGRA